MTAAAKDNDPGDAAPRASRRSPRGEKRRLAILAAAAAEFAAKGYRATSLAAIAERVGISQAGLLHHYPTKEHLLDAVLAQRIEDDTVEVERQLAEHDTGPLAFYTELIAKHLRAPENMRLIEVLAVEGLTEDHPAHELMRQRYERLRESAQRRLHRQMQAGTLRDDLDAEKAATLMLAVMDGLQIQWMYDDSLDMVGVLTHLGTLLAPLRSAGD